jgi:hypothetical protein
MYSRIGVIQAAMHNTITAALQHSGGRLTQASHFARTLWTVIHATVAVVAGITTLNMAVANLGMATLNEVASPVFQQCARFGRQG